jgi:hypothetical protein
MGSQLLLDKSTLQSFLQSFPTAQSGFSVALLLMPSAYCCTLAGVVFGSLVALQ